MTLLDPSGKFVNADGTAASQQAMRLHAEVTQLVVARDAILKSIKVQQQAVRALLDAYDEEIKKRGKALEFLGEKQPGGKG